MADNYQVKNAANTDITISARDEGSGIYSPRFTPRVSGLDLGPTNPMPVRSGLVFVSNEFTRPSDTTAYAVGDVVCNSTSSPTLLEIANCAREDGGTGFIVLASVAFDQKSITPSFRVHVFNLGTASIANDNAAHKELYADVGKKIASFVIGPLWTPSDTTNSTVSRISDSNLRIPFKCSGSTKSLFFIFESLSAFTPANAGKVTFTLGVDQN